MKMANSNEYWMEIALQEARKGIGRTSPNPSVGAVLVRKNKLLAKGHHRRAGLPHAEIEALKRTKSAKGAKLFVTLEPCCHSGKRTPPCVDSIIKAGITEVVVGTLDPNPKVAGGGVRSLKRAGIKTKVGVLREECREINASYNHWIRKKTPWVKIKIAASLDGKVALSNGESLWITSEESRREVHRIRSEVDAVLVGIGTVQIDDPQLNVRGRKVTRQPVRIVLDPRLKISQHAKILKKSNGGPCWIVTSARKVNSAKAKDLVRRGANVISCPLKSSGKFDVKKLLKILGKREILSLLVEGGPITWTGFIQPPSFHELLLFLAPKLFGGDGRSFLGPLSLKKINRAIGLSLSYLGGFGEDLLLKFRPE